VYRVPLEIPVGEEVLNAHITTSSVNRSPSVLFLHGAGTATKERANSITSALADRAISSLSIDFSGHGTSTGDLKQSSIKKRVAEAIGALDVLDSPIPPALCGFSMGGHVALEVMRRRKVRALALFYPAVYADVAYARPFGDGFRELIRKQGSWQTSTAPSVLRSFGGRFFLAIGENDDVIPAGVVPWLITQAARAASSEVFVVPGAGHQLLPMLVDHPDTEGEILDALARTFAPDVAE